MIFSAIFQIAGPKNPPSQGVSEGDREAKCLEKNEISPVTEVSHGGYFFLVF